MRKNTVTLTKFPECSNMADVQEQVDDLKSKGNEAMKKGNVEEAIKCYTSAINLDSDNHILYSNRSAAYVKHGKYSEALNDAEKTINLKPDWPKGYSRKGAALSYLNRHEEAKLVYEDGLKHDPNNEQLKEGIREAESHLTGPAGSQPLVNPFADPLLMAKLEANPTTKELLKQPDYKLMVEQIAKDPKELGKRLNDPRIMTTLGALLGVDLRVHNPNSPEAENTEPMDTSTNQESKTASQTSSNEEKPSKKAETPEDNVDSNTEQALAEKEKGNAAYKKKDFATALQHYGTAVELDPNNITFRTNRAAVYFEQGDYDACIKECKEAAEIGREMHADFKLLAKAFSRIANAYMKKGDQTNALAFFHKSVAEHRAPDVVKKMQELEKKIKEQERLDYVNPEISLEEKKKGNECFQKGDYAGALKHYGEAIRRNPQDAKIFSNRAACYTKLMEFQYALRDCDECIRLDPTFVKGYLRKGANLLAIKDHTKAAQAYQKAMELDPNCAEAIDGYRKCIANESPEEIRKRAMQDPEVQAILGDPTMQVILKTMQEDPKAAQEHLKNPEIAGKIEKLFQAGLLSFR